MVLHRGNFTRAVAVFAAIAVVARAEISSTVFEMTASNASGQAAVMFQLSLGQWDADGTRFCLAIDEPMELYDEQNGQTIAWLLGVNMCVDLRNHAQVSLATGVYSGTSMTHFYVRSPLVTVRTVPERDSVCRVVGSVTVTDVDGNFAQVVGTGTSGSGVCRAWYNGEAPQGTLHSQLVGFVFAGSHATVTGGQQDPPFGFRDIADDVHDISMCLGFRVTPNDIAYVTTSMVVPEPANRCDGDINTDFIVDLFDLTAFLTAFGTSVGNPLYNINADFNEDGDVSVPDMTQMLAYFGNVCP